MSGFGVRRGSIIKINTASVSIKRGFRTCRSACRVGLESQKRVNDTRPNGLFHRGNPKIACLHRLCRRQLLLGPDLVVRVSFLNRRSV